jgi:hypothetical protein
MEHASLYSVPVSIRVLSRFLANNRPARTVAAVWAGLLTVLHFKDRRNAERANLMSMCEEKVTTGSPTRA